MAQNVIINGVTYNSVPQVNIPLASGGTAHFYDTSDATLTSGDQMLSGYTAYANGTKYTGAIVPKAASDMTVSGATVTVPAGYYASDMTKTIATGSASTPASTITANPTISVSATGLVTVTASSSQSITPTVTPGYIAQGTAGTVTVKGSNTKQLDTTSITEGKTTVSGTTATRGTATWNTGWIQTGTIQAATFANSATSGRTYVDISSTDDAPVLIAGDSLYINKGYVDDIKISLAKLVPDGASANLASGVILSGYSAYNSDGTLVAGSIPSKAAATYNVSTSNQTIAAGQYLSGAQTIRAVTTANISAANIKSGITIKVGDSADDDRIITATGTFTAANTVSNGQVAAGADQIVSGYSAFVDGVEVKGSIASNGPVSGTISTKAGTVTVPAGYTSGGSVSIASAEQAKIISGNIRSGVTILGVAGSSTVVDTALTTNVANASRILNGYKAFVNGEQITGTLTTPVVSQDSATKVLSIS